jgi:hypothetical protein
VTKEAQHAYKWLLKNTDLTRDDLDGLSETELIDHYIILKES